MTGTLNAKCQPCKNGDFPVSIAAVGLLPITRYSVVIGPTSATPPVTFADWLGAAQTTVDEVVPVETRVKAPGGITLNATFLCPQLGAATAGDPCWLGLFGAIAPSGSDQPELVVQLPNIAAIH